MVIVAMVQYTHANSGLESSHNLMKKQINWGILSTARINRHLIPQMHKSARSQLRAVASRDIIKAQAYADEWEIPNAYGSYEALLNDPEIDAVYISLPNTLHAEWTIAAANAGKHILCEKPIVQTLDDFDRIAQSAQENNIHLVEAFANLHHPQQHHVLTLLNEGRIGNLQQIVGWFYFYLPPERTDNIRLSSTLGGGSLWDIGVYSNALSIFFAGGKAPQSVWGTKVMGETGVDIAFTGQMHFTNDVTSQITCGFRNPMRETLNLVGDKGAIEILTPHNASGENETQVLVKDINGNHQTITIPPKNVYLSEVEAMEARLLDDAEPLLPLSLSREFLKSILALHESAQTNALVHLE